MSHFRDKFVGNADSLSVWRLGSLNTSQDNLGYAPPSHAGMDRTTPYSPIENGHSKQAVPQMRLRDDSQPNLLDANQRYDSNASADLYELSDIRKNPFEQSQSSFQTPDPFQSSYTSNIQGYSVVPAQTDVPNNYMNASRDDNYLLDKHIALNERNRRKLENRFPRFHYTKLPWFSILVTTAQVIVFIVELVKMGVWTGSPFQTKPYFNPMLGPSTYVLINMGARYVPCMHKLLGITLDTSIQFPCPNSTSVDTNVCNLNELCGLSGIPIVDDEYVPSQYYRVILPIFLHAGFLHILFNLILQLTMGIAVERAIGCLKYGIIYIASGVSGFLLGANFSPNGVASTGASGSLFGIIAANFLLFIYCGTKNTNIYETKRYKTFIIIMILEILVSFVLGLLPGLDNFSHIGGFGMGILTSIVLLPDPSFVFVNGIYTYDPETPTWKLFVDGWNPLSKYKDKVPWKIAAWSMARIASLALAIVYFALLTKNLKSKRQESNEETCSWCKYINCIPVNGWCEQGEVTVSTSSNSGSTSSPTSTTASSGETTAAVFNAPTKRELFTALSAGQSSTGTLTLTGAKRLTTAARPDMGSVALLMVVALLCYNAGKKLKGKMAVKLELRKSRKQPRAF
ncbi:Rhomboid family protein [Metschnikowia aff. pulcherrima]|uniref:Rhomboid-type serine protease n=1 Tax=Metschnikowia aff. pulcherrima TaxID=2163413 RepID=A0A4V1AEG4_9ASCO|nr:Rhomboid family protein [Metschnikowia aff. pulcherrima]